MEENGYEELVLDQASIEYILEYSENQKYRIESSNKIIILNIDWELNPDLDKNVTFKENLEIKDKNYGLISCLVYNLEEGQRKTKIYLKSFTNNNWNCYNSLSQINSVGLKFESLEKEKKPIILVYERIN